MRRIVPAIFFLLLIALFGIFLLWPIWQTVQVGFYGVPKMDEQGTLHHGAFTFEFVTAIFRNQDLRRGLLHSAAIAIAVTLLCTVISVPLAILNSRFDFFGKGLASGLLL